MFSYVQTVEEWLEFLHFSNEVSSYIKQEK